MKKEARLKKYVELFTRNLEKYLSSNITVKTKIYPVEAEGAVFEFFFNSDNDSTLHIEPLNKSVGAGEKRT